MTVLLATVGVCLASAWIPVINAEAYLAAVATQQPLPWWALALAATVGQMIGKVGFFLLGRQSLSWGWLTRRMAKANVGRWVDRMTGAAEARPWAAWAVVLASAGVGLPPFAVISFLAGQVRVSLLAFCVLGSAGRFARFAGIVLGVESLTDLL
ncbi:MAG: hypothetical protein M3Q87_07445 [Actinomycetota bacterium]|nr:hypothetical protein [Actinomycetota bacterium]